MSNIKAFIKKKLYYKEKRANGSGYHTIACENYERTIKPESAYLEK